MGEIDDNFDEEEKEYLKRMDESSSYFMNILSLIIQDLAAKKANGELPEGPDKDSILEELEMLDDTFVDRMCDAIEGGKGHVRWS
jgi:hypothetical protein